MPSNYQPVEIDRSRRWFDAANGELVSLVQTFMRAVRLECRAQSVDEQWHELFEDLVVAEAVQRASLFGEALSTAFDIGSQWVSKLAAVCVERVSAAEHRENSLTAALLHNQANSQLYTTTMSGVNLSVNISPMADASNAYRRGVESSMYGLNASPYADGISNASPIPPFTSVLVELYNELSARVEQEDELLEITQGLCTVCKGVAFQPQPRVVDRNRAWRRRAHPRREAQQPDNGAVSDRPPQPEEDAAAAETNAALQAILISVQAQLEHVEECDKGVRQQVANFQRTLQDERSIQRRLRAELLRAAEQEAELRTELERKDGMVLQCVLAALSATEAVFHASQESLALTSPLSSPLTDGSDEGHFTAHEARLRREAVTTDGTADGHPTLPTTARSTGGSVLESARESEMSSSHDADSTTGTLSTVATPRQVRFREQEGEEGEEGEEEDAPARTRSRERDDETSSNTDSPGSDGEGGEHNDNLPADNWTRHSHRSAHTTGVHPTTVMRSVPHVEEQLGDGESEERADSQECLEGGVASGDSFLHNVGKKHAEPSRSPSLGPLTTSPHPSLVLGGEEEPSVEQQIAVRERELSHHIAHLEARVAAVRALEVDLHGAEEALRTREESIRTFAQNLSHTNDVSGWSPSQFRGTQEAQRNSPSPETRGAHEGSNQSNQGNEEGSGSTNNGYSNEGALIPLSAEQVQAYTDLEQDTTRIGRYPGLAQPPRVGWSEDEREAESMDVNVTMGTSSQRSSGLGVPSWSEDIRGVIAHAHNPISRGEGTDGAGVRAYFQPDNFMVDSSTLTTEVRDRANDELFRMLMQCKSLREQCEVSRARTAHRLEASRHDDPFSSFMP